MAGKADCTDMLGVWSNLYRRFAVEAFQTKPEPIELASIQTCPYHLTIPVSQLYKRDTDNLREAIEGRLVVLGGNLIGVSDFIETPVHGNLAGVYSHAGALDNLIREGTNIYKYNPANSPPWKEVLEFVLTFLGCLLVALWRRPGDRKLKPWKLKRSKFPRYKIKIKPQRSLRKLYSWLMLVVIIFYGALSALVLQSFMESTSPLGLAGPHIWSIAKFTFIPLLMAAALLAALRVLSRFYGKKEISDFEHIMLEGALFLTYTALIVALALFIFMVFETSTINLFAIVAGVTGAHFLNFRSSQMRYHFLSLSHTATKGLNAFLEKKLELSKHKKKDTSK